MTKPYIVLGTYTPQTPWRAWRVGRDLTRLTEELGLVPINDPNHNHQSSASWHDKSLCAYVRRRTVQNPKAGNWHQDGDLVAGAQMDNYLVLWASNTSTILRIGNSGNVYRPNKREIILFHNLGCEHRRPDSCPSIRWIFRQRVETPTNLEELNARLDC